MSERLPIRLHVNGALHDLDVEPRRLLSDALSPGPEKGF